jgi:PhoPQ-activated pathogenicity-related protein
MKRTLQGFSAALVLLFLTAIPARAGSRTALDDYIAKPDSHFSFKLVRTLPGEGGTAYVLEMVSQQWLTEKEVDKPIWKHWVTIIKPENVASDTALLFITGGSNERPAPDRVDNNLVRVARESKGVVAELKMVPNQPLVFAGETKGRPAGGWCCWRRRWRCR